MSSESPWHPVVVCPNPNCGKGNRIRPHLAGQKPVCGRCGRELPDPFGQAVVRVCPKHGPNRVFSHPEDLAPVCGKCGASLYAPVEQREPGDAVPTAGWVESPDAYRKLPFEILPPGNWTVEEMIRHYESEAERLRQHGITGVLEPERIRALWSLGPVDKYVGTGTWLGYRVFTFGFTDRVVLECPISGNATYVLWGDWVHMVSYTKQDLRRRFRSNYVKIIHQGDWLERVKAVLGRKGKARRQGWRRSKSFRSRRS